MVDEQFRPLTTGSNSGYASVGSAEIINPINQVANITKSGYLYIYCSNENNVDVFFENIQLIHTGGPLLEETHYYPFGLTMAGISSKAAGKLENKHKYNGIELSEDLGLNTYDAFFRNLDPQTGRWWQIDPKFEWEMENWSPYASNFDNPILYSDPKGDCPLCLIPIIIGLLTTSTPANPPSSLPSQYRTEAAYKSWDNAVHNRDLHIVGSLLSGGAKVVVNAIDNTYNKLRKPDEVNNSKEPELKVTNIGKTKTGDTRVKAERGDSRLDITNDRVKEYVKESKNPGTGERQVNFKKEGLPDNSQIVPGSKGLKRTPTPDEQKLLDANKPKN